MDRLIIFGAGGMGRETAWLTERINKTSPTWELLGFMDDDDSIQGKSFNGYPVIGKTQDILRYKDAYFVVAIGASKVREKIVSNMKALCPDIKFAVLIDPDVEMSELVSMGEGSIICAGSVLTVNITVGEHVIIDPCCTVGHDSVIGDLVILYPGAHVSGAVTGGRCSELGVGSQIIQCKTIGDNTIIGAGAVVISDIPPNCTAVGCPAKPIKFHE